MVAKVVRLDGKLMIELDDEAERALGSLLGQRVDIRVDGDSVVVSGVSLAFEREARATLSRHAQTFEKLSK